MGKKVRDKTIKQIVDIARDLHITCEKLSNYYMAIWSEDFSDEHIYTIEELRKIREQLRRAEKKLDKFVEGYIDQEEWADYT